MSVLVITGNITLVFPELENAHKGSFEMMIKKQQTNEKNDKKYSISKSAK